jgi:membrane protease YdiL (CAAX protease family)
MGALTLLLENPFAFVAYILVIGALFACWFYQKYFLFAPIYAIAYGFAYLGKIVTYTSLFPLILIILCLLILEFHPKRFIHLFGVMIVAVIGLAIMTHMLNGFNNLLLLKSITYGNSKTPLNLYLNFDKISFAILLLGISIPLLKSKQEWKHMILITIPWIAFSAFILLGFTKLTSLVQLDIKLPETTFYWIIINFFFVVIPEEAFYRGFLQYQISKNLENKAAPALAILCVSLLFALVHIIFIQDVTFILAAFIASVLYGTIFFFSGSIESAIITHFLVNMIHFFFFSYPVR